MVSIVNHSVERKPLRGRPPLVPSVEKRKKASVVNIDSSESVPALEKTIKKGRRNYAII